MRRQLRDLQIRKVPPALHERLRRRARGKGVSMSQYVIDVLREDLERPTMAEWIEEVLRLPSAPGPSSGAALVREVRREWEAEIAEETDR